MMTKKTGARSVLIVSGPTGGHFYPALAFAHKFRTNHRSMKIRFFFTRLPHFVQQALEESRLPYRSLELASPDRWTPLRVGTFAFSYLKAFFKSLVWLKRERICLVISFGSYATIPTTLAASLLNVPILIHEQNVCPGNANHFLSFWAERIALSFP